MVVWQWEILSGILGSMVIWNAVVNYLRHPKSSFDGIDKHQEVALAEKIKTDFAKALEKYGLYVPESALRYSVEDIKRAFKLISVHDRCNDEYRAALRDSFAYISNVYSDSDAALMQSRLLEESFSKLSDDQFQRWYFLQQRSHIRFNILNYEWDDWMLENHIKQECSYDDIQKQAYDLKLTVDDLQDIDSGETLSMEGLIAKRQERTNNTLP